MSFKSPFGKGTYKHPTIEDPEPNRSKISIDWDSIAKAREERIRWEIAQGLEPIERFELPEYQEESKPASVHLR